MKPFAPAAPAAARRDASRDPALSSVAVSSGMRSERGARSRRALAAAGLALALAVPIGAAAGAIVGLGFVNPARPMR